MKKLFAFALLAFGIFPIAFAQAATTVGQVGGSATFTVKADGTAPFQYTWFKDGVVVTGSRGIGAAFATLVISPLKLTDAGNYTVSLENAAGRTDSAPVPIAITLVVKASNVTVGVTIAPPAGTPTTGTTP